MSRLAELLTRIEKKYVTLSNENWSLSDIRYVKVKDHNKAAPVHLVIFWNEETLPLNVINTGI